tara:strand:- start:90 stop:386 length:297 start_codon:yes stop_codon:yes gene_type:complete
MNIETLMEYVWTPFVALGFYLFKNISSRLSMIERDMNLYVTKSYVQEEIKPDLMRLEVKMDKLVEQTADVIGRSEYKADIGNLYSKCSELAEKKADRS